MKPDIKPENLVCPDEPIPDLTVMTDVAFAKWAEAVRLAGGTCRAKLTTVREALEDKPTK